MERKQSKKVKSLRAAAKDNGVKQLQKQIQGIVSDQISFTKGLVPPHVVQSYQRIKRRFNFGTNFSGNITYGDLHQQFLVATSSTTAATYVDGWRIRKATVFARNNEADYSVQVQLTPNSADSTNNLFNNLPKTYAVESQSSANASIMVYKPSAISPVGQWHRTASANSSASVFAIATSSNGGSIDGNTILEIDFEVLLNTFGALTSYSLTGLTGLVVGSLYGSPLAGGLIPTLDVNHI